MTEDVLATQLELGAALLAWGEGASAVQMAATFGEYEAEYAAIHRHVAILHRPQRGILRLTGSEADRRDFLHRLTTQDVRSMPVGTTRRALQLNDKGRIVADLLIHHGGEDTWLETDVSDIGPLQQLLEARLFAEDVQLHDWRRQRVFVSLYGPAAPALLQRVADSAAAPEPGVHFVSAIAGAPATVYRRDDAGGPATFGLHLALVPEAAEATYRRLLDAAGYEADERDAAFADRRRQSLRGRPIGWLAYNTARIEAGTALFHIDFGPDSLPHEAGPRVLSEAVSFTKGCYLGQEIVARMQNLGHPRKLTVGIRWDGDALPDAGAAIVDPADRATVIGAVSSSAVSPMLGGASIALSTVKWGRHTPGTKLATTAEGRPIDGEVLATPFVK